MTELWQWTDEGPEALDGLSSQLDHDRAAGKVIVTTNGCFDLLHTGHIRFLREAKAQGDVLVVGLNSDASVSRLKGAGRPIVPQAERASLLGALAAVDYVVIFDDLYPNDFLAQIRPNVHCKSGDYSAETLPEAEVVKQYGGIVCILPLTAGYSTSQLVNRILASVNQPVEPAGQTAAGDRLDTIVQQLFDGSNVLRHTAYQLGNAIAEAAAMLIQALRDGHKVLICGNGGSAADAQHFAAELVGRFRRDRNPWPALALTTDTSALTSISNDYGFEQIYARQVEAFGQRGDILVAISTSGASPNVLRAVEQAQAAGMTVIGMTGAKVSPLSSQSQACLSVPSQNTAYIQQAHIAIIHVWCEVVERALAGQTR